MPEIIMKMIQRFTLCLLALLWPAALFASINLPGDPDGPLGSAAGIFRGTVLRIEAYSNPTDGLIYTRTVFQVAEALKGSFSSTVLVTYRGGQLDVGGADRELYEIVPKACTVRGPKHSKVNPNL